MVEIEEYREADPPLRLQYRNTIEGVKKAFEMHSAELTHIKIGEGGPPTQTEWSSIVVRGVASETVIRFSFIESRPDDHVNVETVVQNITDRIERKLRAQQTGIEW